MGVAGPKRAVIIRPQLSGLGGAAEGLARGLTLPGATRPSPFRGTTAEGARVRTGVCQGCGVCALHIKVCYTLVSVQLCICL